MEDSDTSAAQTTTSTAPSAAQVAMVNQHSVPMLQYPTQVQMQQMAAGVFPNPNTMALLQQRAQQVEQLRQFWRRTMSEVEQLSPDISDFKSQSLPLARIKKIMKSDEDVRMISAEAPILFAKACEMFILELTLRSWMHSEENKRRTLQRNDIAAAITRTDIFDFLVDIVPRDDFRTTTAEQVVSSVQQVPTVMEQQRIQTGQQIQQSQSQQQIQQLAQQQQQSQPSIQNQNCTSNNLLDVQQKLDYESGQGQSQSQPQIQTASSQAQQQQPPFQGLFYPGMMNVIGQQGGSVGMVVPSVSMEQLGGGINQNAMLGQFMLPAQWANLNMMQFYPHLMMQSSLQMQQQQQQQQLNMQQFKQEEVIQDDQDRSSEADGDGQEE